MLSKNKFDFRDTDMIPRNRLGGGAYADVYKLTDYNSQ